MKKKLMVLFVVCSISCVANSYTINEESLDSVVQTINKAAAKEFYEHENRILKETYQSNIQALNIIITISLLLMGIFGFFGLRDIDQKKKEYQENLTNLKKLITISKVKSERVLNEIIQEKELIIHEHESLKTKIKEIEKEIEAYQSHTKKMDLLNEIERNKKLRNFDEAKKINEKALIDFPKDLDFLLSMASLCYDLRDYQCAKDYYIALYNVDKQDDNTLLDICELSLFIGDINEHEKYKSFLVDKYGNRKYLSTYYYFDAIKAFLNNDVEKLEEIIQNFEKENDRSIYFDWILDDFFIFIKSKPDSEIKDRLIKFIELLEKKH